MWSFVGNKSNKQWIWLALDVQTKEVIGVHVGDRSRKGARKLGSSLPPVYRQCAVCYSDFWEAYEQVIPSQRHQAVGKETGQTNYIALRIYVRTFFESCINTFSNSLKFFNSLLHPSFENRPPTLYLV